MITLIRRERARVVAIAEVGLPWYTVRERLDREALIAAGEPRLQRFLQMARELDLAVVLHARHETARALWLCSRRSAWGGRVPLAQGLAQGAPVPSSRMGITSRSRPRLVIVTVTVNWSPWCPYATS